jgi:hypothetical protein
MWSDVVIGTGVSGNSAVKVFSIPGDHNISENKVSYWISRDEQLDIGMTIFKDTEEGKYLARLISRDVGLAAITTWLQNIKIKNCNSELLKRKIDFALQRSFEAGKNAKAQEIRNALGVE